MKFVFYPLAILLLLLTAAGFLSVAEIMFCDIALFLWMLAGIAAFVALSFLPAIRKNAVMFRVFSHEMTHTVVCLMFFRKITAFNASVSGGVVYHTGGKRGDLFIRLAPYCLPIYTFAFAILRLLSSDGALFIFDILIGFTLAFHLGCFAVETRPKQPDIKRSGYLTSALFIPTALFFNLSIILLTVLSNFGEAFVTLFAKYGETIAQWWKLIF